jgi:hypothetical protein
VFTDGTCGCLNVIFIRYYDRSVADFTCDWVNVMLISINDRTLCICLLTLTKAFQLFSISRRYVVSYSLGML